MKLLLINPYDPVDKEFGPPRMGLGLAYIASVVRETNKVEVVIFDKFAKYRKYNFNAAQLEKELCATITNYKPDIVSFSSYTETISDVIKDARTIKKILPNSLIILGGAHATALPIQTLKAYDFVDIAIIEEGENTILL